MRPKDVTLEKWPSGWLKMECASILREECPTFLLLHDHEKRDRNYPVTDEAMRDLIRKSRLETGVI